MFDTKKAASNDDGAASLRLDCSGCHTRLLMFQH